MIKMIIVPNVTCNTNITAVLFFMLYERRRRRQSGGCAMSKEKSRLDDHGHYREKKRIVRCEEMDKRDDRFV
jgi:hypothetical protein